MTEYVILLRQANGTLTEVGEGEASSARVALDRFLEEHQVGDMSDESFVVCAAGHWTEIDVGIEQPPPKLTVKSVRVRRPKNMNKGAEEVDPNQTTIDEAVGGKV